MLQGAVILGRDELCDVVIPDRQVSRQHARISATPAGILLEDLDSKNGTHLNGAPVDGNALLQDGDIVQIALAQQFIYLSSDATLPLEVGLVEPAPLEPASPRRLRLDTRARRVWIEAVEILPPLSASQFHLLDVLYDNQGDVVSRDVLINAVWGDEVANGVSEQALDALVRRLRDRIAAIDPSHTYINTIRGHGLRLENPPEEED
jgi:predicted component of type VI protein secretion system